MMHLVLLIILKMNKQDIFIDTWIQSCRILERKVEFFRQNLGITGKAGRVIVYPPTWEYPYRVSDKAEDDTYCLQSYIHYG